LTLHSDALGAELGVMAYGHYGRPVLAFPAERGHCWDYENRGMIAAIADLIDGGRVKVYCVDTIDGQTWHDASLPLEERARRHGLYEDWIVNHVAPFVHADCGGAQEIIVNGPSFGAYHAANLALKRADLFPLAICQSCIYDVSVVGWGGRGNAVYFNFAVRSRHGWTMPPTSYVPSTRPRTYRLMCTRPKPSRSGRAWP
jgi:esterase/lipase superfamily enzyme